MKANQYDGLQVENVFFYIPDYVPGGAGNLWTLNRVSKWTFSPVKEEAASITFTAPETGKLILAPVLIDALEEDDVEAVIYHNEDCVFGPVVAKKEERHGVSTLMFDVTSGDTLRFEIKTLGGDTTADWPISLFYAKSWVREDEAYIPSDAEELTRSEFFAGLVKDIALPCPHHCKTFSDVTEEDPCYNALYELSVRGAIPRSMVQDNNIFPQQSINGYEALQVLVQLWESFRRPLQGETILQKAEALGLSYYNGVISPKQAKELFAAFNEARKTPVGRTAHGEYSPVYKGMIREDLDIQKLIEDAYFSGASEVTIPEGIYRVPVADPDKSRVPQTPLFSKACAMSPHLCLNGFKNFTVRGYGVTLLFQSRPNIGVLISGAENITFEGITLDYEPQIFTQGLIKAINFEEGYIDFEVEDGYPVDFLDPERYGRMVSGDFYKADGEIATSASSFSYPREILSQVAENRYRFSNQNMIGLPSGVEAGDYVAFRSEKIANTFYVELTDGFSVTDVTVYTGNVGLSVSYGNDTRRGYFTRYQNVPGPAPLGALVPRFVSTSGTAYHCTGLRESFTATDCYVRNNGDDGTNIHGVHSRLCADLGENTYVIGHPNSLGYFEEGDPIRFYDNDYGLMDEEKLVSAELLDDYEPTVNLERNIGVWTFRPRRFFKVKTARPIRCEVGGWITNEREICQGFELKRCRFIGGRARGILAKAGGLVEDCKVYRRPVGLMAAPEMHWLESDHVFDLTVKNTEVSHCGFGRHPLLAYGATVHAYASTKSRNILLENCYFHDNFRMQLHVNKAKDMTIKNCTFGDAPYAYAHLTVDNGENVVLENNTFEGTLPVFVEETADARFFSMHKKGRWE